MWRLAFLLLCSGCGGSSGSSNFSGADSSITPPDSVVTFSLPKSDSATAMDGDVCGSSIATDQQYCAWIQGGTRFDLNVGVDAGTCEGRPTVACNGTCTAGEALDFQMMDLVLQCGFVPDESSVTVTFSGGCAQFFTVHRPGPYEDTITECIASALSASHFACADQIPCWGEYFTTLPP